MIKKTLKLNKKTIANLSKQKMRSLKGGEKTYEYPPCDLYSDFVCTDINDCYHADTMGGMGGYSECMMESPCDWIFAYDEQSHLPYQCVV